ncbi:MAG: hypothetical protein AB7H77_07015 [Bdellovibrionales bacterium]
MKGDVPTQGIKEVRLETSPAVPFRLKDGGTIYRMKFDWAAMAKLEADYGGIDKLPPLNTLFDIAHFAAVGMQVYHPGTTAEEIMAQSPPVLVLQTAISLALQYAYHGGEEPPVVEPGNEVTKKKHPWWKKPFARRTARA